MVFEKHITWFKNKYSPLWQLLIIGFVVRLISVIFSKGYGWHDDHFLVVEPAQNWLDGYPNAWLPNHPASMGTPGAHPFTYPGIHYVLFYLLEAISIYDPQVKMFVMRLLHALWSLLIIYFGYKITLHYSNKKVAWYVGLMLALLWFMPFISVRNLAEFVCVPPTLACIWYLIKKELSFKNYIISGLFLGLAFSLRFQTLFLIMGIGIALIVLKTNYKLIIAFVLSTIFSAFLFSGLIDVFMWGYPFAELLAYILINFKEATIYANNIWHMYPDLLLGLTIPPLSIALLLGYFKVWKKLPMLFLPVFFYLAFHMYFINKQERFILTIMPLYIIAGSIGAYELYQKFKTKINPKLVKGCVWFVLIINTLLLLLLSPSSGKSHTVDTAYFLSQQKDCKTFMVDQSNKDNNLIMLPLFYFQNWFHVITLSKNYTADSAYVEINKPNGNPKPDYLVVMQPYDLNNRVENIKKKFPKLTFVKEIEPSFLDKTMHWLNPLNDNQTCYIYKINY
ncbi:MAG: glycosyltransferase family 39 protein [Bacteroidetes bacterium]|nr:glycosyltransferase family 39 protein [Bacteroidota bacterium]